jgi:hypothetical protein
MSILNTVKSFARSSSGRQASGRFMGSRGAGSRTSGRRYGRRQPAAPTGLGGLLRRFTGSGGTAARGRRF